MQKLQKKLTVDGQFLSNMSSGNESFQDRQISEINVLRSIFGDELKDLRKHKNRKKWQPLDVIITLTPQAGSSGPLEVHAQIDLHVTCGEKYPEEPPKIRLENSRGLSDQQVQNHLQDLENLAEKLKGEVVIFDLADHVKKFLHENNKPGYSSCYDEMMSKMEERKQSERKKQEEKQIKEDIEKQIIQDEIFKRKEALKEERRYRRESTKMTQSLDNDHFSQSNPSSPLERSRTLSRRRCTSASDSSDILVCEHRGIKVLKFDNHKGERQVQRGHCLGHSVKGSIVYSGVDTSSGELFAVMEWNLKCTPAEQMNGNNNGTTNSNIQNTFKQLTSIEQELNHLQRLSHPNLVRYLNMSYNQEGENIKVYILQEFVVGTTCSFILSENIPIETDLLRYLANGILNALRYLHDNNVVHKDLRDSSIYINNKGVVQLSDYSLDKRLSDIYRTSNLTKVEQDFPTIQSRGGKKADIYRFGILLLSLYQGSIVSEKEVEDLTSLQAITSKPDLRDFISKCVMSNERSRWSTEQLLEHPFIHTPIERGLTPPGLNCNDQKRNQPDNEPDQDVTIHLPSYGGQSRIYNEFEVMKWLGKGAFGDVLKVKNKLDGGVYAIKRIELNPKNKQLNKKITREVKLLSRLNHENVVRYYNSWIESAKFDDPSMHSQFTPCATPSTKVEKQANVVKFRDLLDHNIEKLAPPIQDVEWNVSYQSRVSTVVSEDSEEDNSENSSDSESDEEWSFIMKNTIDQESSDGIEFERDGPSEAWSIKEKFENDGKEKTFSPTKEVQFMYIQMEFCEKSTLRTAIDGGLYKDEERIWRLFREMIEGLVHIHQQGMIHRDLKPVNIFLDSNDHVKIGDFGLATSNILSSKSQTIDVEKEICEKGASLDMEELGSMTGQVGTALYAAPELSAKAAQAIYNQKVDIYSLGIIFFEMCYKSITTGMERVKILLNLRSKEIVLPEDMIEEEASNKVHILRWLLDHDPSHRPTSQELLASDWLPPLRVEESELQEVIRRTLSNAKSKAYKCLIDCCFKQELTPAEDITYDMSLPARGAKNSLVPITTQFLQEKIKSVVSEVFRKHGGTCIITPLLKPKSKLLRHSSESCVQLMTCNGNIVSLPYDLRIPFARYVVFNNITNIRRYAIERVYREKRVHGFHPRELYECAFDIISSTPNNLMSEVELLYVAWEIFNEIPQLESRDFTIQINHTSLLHAVLEYCGVEKERYQDIYSILRAALDGKFSRVQLHTHLFSLCLKDQAMETLYNLLEIENSVPKINSVLKTISRRKGDIGELAKEGLQEIKTVTDNIDALGITWPVKIVPVLVPNIQEYDGIIFQVTKLKRRKRFGQDVIAAGGRYDKMLACFRKELERTGTPGKEQYGVGLSISLEKLVCAACEFSQTTNYSGDQSESGINVAVCFIDDEPRREKEYVEVLKKLWSLDLQVTCLDFRKLEEVLDHCKENKIGHVIVLKNGEKDHLRLHVWERDRFQERKMSLKDTVDHLQRQIDLSKTDGKIIIANNNEFSGVKMPVNVNINFVISDKDKLSNSSKRSHKNAILAQMTSYLQRISCDVPVEIFAVFLEIGVLKTMANYLDFEDDEQDYEKSIQVIIEKHSRHKKYLKQICEELWDTRNHTAQKLVTTSPVLILYSLSDSHYATIM